MSSEEKMQWKEKEEETEIQKKERMEKFDEIEETLLAMEPFNDHIVVYDEKIIETDEAQEKKEDFDNQEEKEELKDKQEIQKEDTREKGGKNAELMIEQVEEQKEDHKEKINENKAMEEVKEDHQKEQIEKQPEMSLEEKKKKLEAIEEVLLKEENYTDQKIIWEDEAQRERVLGVNTEKGEEEEKTRQSIVETGQQAIKTRKHSDIVILTQEWNKYIEKGGRITVDMWEVYNKIQEKFKKPIVLYKEDNEVNRYKMSNSGRLFSQLDEVLFSKRLNNPSKQISKLFDYWLIQTGKKEGIKPFFEVSIKNPHTEKMETYWIPNAKQRKWNPYQAKEQNFFSGHRAAGKMITQFLTKEIKVTEEKFDLYLKMEDELRKNFPKLGVQTGNTSVYGQKILFRTFHKLKYPKEVN